MIEVNAQKIEDLYREIGEFDFLRAMQFMLIDRTDTAANMSDMDDCFNKAEIEHWAKRYNLLDSLECALRDLAVHSRPVQGDPIR